MLVYKVIISDDLSLLINADDFEIKVNVVAFSRGNKNIACFNLSSIKGFYKVDGENIKLIATVKEE